MRIKVAREVEQSQYSRSTGVDHAHKTDVPWLYTQKSAPWMEFAILPALPVGAGHGSQDFLGYRDDEGEFTTWVEAYIIYEGFCNEFRNRTASPTNWNKDATDIFSAVQTAVYTNRDLRDQLYRSGDLILETDGKGDPRPNAKPKVPWSGKTYNYMNVWPTAGPDVELGRVKVLRTTSSSMTTAKGNEDGDGAGIVWGLLDYLDLRNPQNESQFMYPDPTDPDHSSIIRLEKCKAPTNSNIPWWKCAFTRNPKIEISDAALKTRWDLASVINPISEEDAAKHFYEFLTDAPGLIDVMEGLFPEFRPLGRDRVRSAQRVAARLEDELPGLAPRLPAQRTAVGRSPSPAASSVASDPGEEAPWEAPAEAAAPARSSGRTPSASGGSRSSVGGARPVIPEGLKGETLPTSTASMSARDRTLQELLEAPVE